MKQKERIVNLWRTAPETIELQTAQKKIDLLAKPKN